MMGALGEVVVKRLYKEALLGPRKSTRSSTSCRIPFANPAAVVLNGQGGPGVVNPRFFVEGDCSSPSEQSVLQRVKVAQGVLEKLVVTFVMCESRWSV